MSVEDIGVLAHCVPAGVDQCGEGASFHTFVSAGPTFSSPLEVVREVVEREGFVFPDVLPAGGSSATNSPRSSWQRVVTR